MQRIGKEDVEMSFRAYETALRAAGIDTEGLALLYGSKAFGNSFKVVFIDPVHGGRSGAPGADFSGNIGWTKREAYESLFMMARTLEDVKYLYDTKGEAR